MRENRVEFVFLERPFEPSELYRNIVKPAGRETAIEMPQSRNDHSDDRHLDVGARLIEDEEIEALPARQCARRRSPARAYQDGRTSESNSTSTAGSSPGNRKGWSASRNGVVRRGSLAFWRRRATASIDMNWFSSVSVRNMAMRASKCEPEPNSIYSLPVLLSSALSRRKLGMPRSLVMSSTQRRFPRFGQLNLQIAHVGIVELVKIHCRALQPDYTTRSRRHPAPPVQGTPARSLPRRVLPAAQPLESALKPTEPL